MIERLNEIITFQKNTVTVDQYGNHKNTWTDYYTCHAYADTYIKEEEVDVTTSDEQSITFEVRYCSKLAGITSTGYRVFFHDESYNIESVDMMNWKRKNIRLKCRKEKR
jgi:SPP1 family predicted phage head-tail adaptor